MAPIEVKKGLIHLFDEELYNIMFQIYGMQLSAPCRFVEMTAEVLGLEYEFKVVDLMAGENMKPEFLALNPQHNIPCVKDGEFVGNESRAVAAYLASKHGKDDSLYPKDLETRYKVDQRLYFDMGVFYKVSNEKNSAPCHAKVFCESVINVIIHDAYSAVWEWPVTLAGAGLSWLSRSSSPMAGK